MRGKHIAPSHQHYKWQIHRGREGITEHRAGGRGRKSQREHQLSVEKNLHKASPTSTFVLHVITEMPAKQRISLNGHRT